VKYARRNTGPVERHSEGRKKWYGDLPAGHKKKSTIWNKKTKARRGSTVEKEVLQLRMTKPIRKKKGRKIRQDTRSLEKGHKKEEQIRGKGEKKKTKKSCRDS